MTFWKRVGDIIYAVFIIIESLGLHSQFHGLRIGSRFSIPLFNATAARLVA